MSWSLANENGIIEQFATNSGLKELREAVDGKSALEDFLKEGVTKNIEICRHELAQIARDTDKDDVRSTARNLAKLMKDETLVSITNGADMDSEEGRK
jgi:hypothetical protein